MPLNIRIQWNAGTACVSERGLKTLACRGLRVGPSKMLAQPRKSAERYNGQIVGQAEIAWYHSNFLDYTSPYSGMARVRLADLNGPLQTKRDQNGPFWSILVSPMLKPGSEWGHFDQNGRLDHFGPFWSRTLSDSTSATPYIQFFQELISVIVSPPITPNKFWGFNKRNSQEKLHHPVLCLLGKVHHLLHQNILSEL